jgi:hypothetical protein
MNEFCDIVLKSPSGGFRGPLRCGHKSVRGTGGYTNIIPPTFRNELKI